MVVEELPDAAILLLSVALTTLPEKGRAAPAALPGFRRTGLRTVWGWRAGWWIAGTRLPRVTGNRFWQMLWTGL
jgi:hypothetical protein